MTPAALAEVAAIAAKATPATVISPPAPPKRTTLREAIAAKHQKRREFMIVAGEKAGAVWRFEASGRGLARARAEQQAIVTSNACARAEAERHLIFAVSERRDAIAVAQGWMVLRG